MNFDKLVRQINRYPTDIKTEVIISELVLENELSLADCEIKPIGIFDRGHSRDLSKIYKPEGIKKIVFYVTREGIYDTLPPNFFFPPSNEDSENLKNQETGEEFTMEEMTRDFFLPIDNEFFRHRVLLTQIEKSLFSAFTDGQKIKYLGEKFWLLNIMDIPPIQLSKLLYAISFNYQIKGDLENVKSVTEIILGKEINLKLSKGKIQQSVDIALPSLGEIFLGVNSVLGKNYSDGLPRLEIEILNVGPHEVSQFLPTSSQGKLIDLIGQFLLPFEMDIIVTTNILKEKREFKLDDSLHNGRLNHSTILN